MVSEPCGSMSMTSTRWPRRLSPCASVIVVVVLLTPPLKLHTAMVIAFAPFGLAIFARKTRTHSRASASVNSRRRPVSLTTPLGSSLRVRR
ncbi:hypothetical protein D3C72_2033600 [compost metagenome]